MTEPCRAPIYSESGSEYGTMLHREGHDWRLYERKAIEESTFTPQGTEGYLRAYGSVAYKTIGYRELWYCTRCRTVEERDVPR